jgi:predicted O-methyltransferase YrrM
MSTQFKNRRELILHLNETKAELAAEVGVREGYFSKFILDNTSVKKLYAIDPWENNAELSDCETVFRTCKGLLDPFGDRAEMVKGYSPFAAEMFEDGSLDFIYIDGLHDYESVKADIAGFYPKLKVGGIIAGHDYHLEDWPGVYNAVNEFISENKLEINVTGTDSPDREIEHDGWKPSWWAIKK